MTSHANADAAHRDGALVQGKLVAVIGGGPRELEIGRLLEESGAKVRTYGTPESAEHRDWATASLEAALSGAEIVVTPMPGIAVDGTLYAPHSAEPLLLDAAAFKSCAPGAVVFAGHSTPDMRVAGEANQIRFADMGQDDILQVQHAIPTAEAAIARAILNTEETLLHSRPLVVGYGRIGQLLAHYLQGFGSKVTVAARRPEVRARAEALGHAVVSTGEDDLVAAISEATPVFVTASAMLIKGPVAEAVRQDALVIDLASPPGGVDYEQLRERKIAVVWARGQADTSAIHSARAQFKHIMSALQEQLR